MSMLKSTLRCVFLFYMWRKHLKGTETGFWVALTNPNYRAVVTTLAPRGLWLFYSSIE